MAAFSSEHNMSLDSFSEVEEESGKGERMEKLDASLTPKRCPTRAVLSRLPLGDTMRQTATQCITLEKDRK